MLALKRGPALLDHFAEVMPMTRSIKQRLEEEEQFDIYIHTGAGGREAFLQPEAKDTHGRHTYSFALAADGSAAGLHQSSNITTETEPVVINGAAGTQQPAIAAKETSKQAQHGAQYRHGDASAGPSSEQSFGSASGDSKNVSSQANLPALCCRIDLPTEIAQSPMRTRSQDPSEAGLSRLSSSTEEYLIPSVAAFESSQQHFFGVTRQPDSSTQQPKSPRVRRHRISLTLGTTDGGATISQSTAVTTLRSCLRKASIKRSTDLYTPVTPSSPPGSPLTRSHSQIQLALSEQDQHQQQQLREGLPTRQSSRVASQTGRRVCFADGPLQDIYGTPDGHPSHEGQTARQRRSLNTSYPVDLTPHSIRMLEQELGKSYRLSINRLKRRVGLLPRISRPREFVTHTKSAPKPRQIPVGLPQLRVLRPRLPSAEDSDESGMELSMNDSESSSTLSNDAGSPARRSLRSTASSMDSPKAAWTANSGGVRHGATRSISGSRRKSTAPARARPQSPLPGGNFSMRQTHLSEPLSPPEEQVMKKPSSPRTPKHSRGPFGRSASPRKAQQHLHMGSAQAAAGADSSEPSVPPSPKPGRSAGQAVPRIFQSPRKRPSGLTTAEDGAPDCPPRSPRRQRPLSSWNSNSLLGSMSNALKSSAAFALPTPLPQQHCFLLRSSSAKGSLAEAAESQQTMGRRSGSSPDLHKKASHPDSSSAAEQPAGSADMAKQAPDEAPWMGRRLRSADSLARQDATTDIEGAAPGLRAAIYDSIMSHTRLLRSSSK